MAAVERGGDGARDGLERSAAQYEVSILAPVH